MSAEEKLRFGSYEVLRNEDGTNIVLGKGGFGRIYKAKHTILGRIAALKVIKEEHLHTSGGDDKEKISEFKAEARSVARLNHPGIAHIHDCASEDGVFYQATEYCEGGTLQQYCEHNGPITWETARPMVIKILEGLGYAHSNGIVHRDIKPANIMLAKEGSLADPKIIDFGLAKSLGADNLDPSLTLRNSPADAGGHTPATASPEQLRGAPDEPPDERTDLFSLGVTIWWVLLGKNPFGEMKTGPLYADRLSPASYESRLPNEFHPEARKVLLMLLEKDRNKRVRSAANILDELGATATVASPAETVINSPARELAAEVEPMAVPPDFEDGWSLVNLIRSAPHAKLYEARSISDALRGIAVNADPDMDLRMRAGMRLAASKQVDMGAFRFLDWRLNGTDDVFILTPPSGCSLLSILRKLGSTRFRDALPFFVRLARSYDTSSAWLGCGIQIDPSDVLVRHTDGSSDPEAFRSWDDIDTTSLSCLPMFDDGGETDSSTEATISTSTQGFPPLARFAALVYRVVSGSAVSHAAFYTDSGYVMASGFSEDGNTLIADTLCDSGIERSFCHFLQMLAGLESQQVGEITHLIPHPDAAELAAASLPLRHGDIHPATAPMMTGGISVDDEIARMERELETKKREAAEKKTAEEAEALKAAFEAEAARLAAEAAKKAAEEAALKAEADRLAEEAQKAAAELAAMQEREKKRLAEEAAAKIAAQKAAAEKAAVKARILEEAKAAAERAQKERDLELLREQQEKEKREAEQAAEAARIAQAQKDAEAARLAAIKKKEEEDAAAEKERQRLAKLDEESRKKEERLAAEKAERDRLAAKKAEAEAEKKRQAAIKQRELEERKAAAAALAAQKKAEIGEKAKGNPTANPDKNSKKVILIAAAVIALVAIVSVIAFSSGEKPIDPVVEKPPTEVQPPPPDPIVKKPEKEKETQPDPPPAPKPTFTVNITKPPDIGDGYSYFSFALSGEGIVTEIKSDTEGRLSLAKAKPESNYTITLFGDYAGKKEVPLATAKIKLPKEPKKDTSLEIKLPASLPALEIRNPYAYSDYAKVTVVPPNSKTEIVSLETLTAQQPMIIEMKHLSPSPGIDKLPELPFPTNENPLRLLALSSGNWTITYSGSQLAKRVETVTTSASERLEFKEVPKPISGKYRALLPMTRFPDGKANIEMKPIAGAPRKNSKGQWEVDYFHRMVYPDTYSELFKILKHKTMLNQRELPHYLAVFIEMRLTEENKTRSRVELVWSSPAPEITYSKSDHVEIDILDGEVRDGIKLAMTSSGGFFRGPDDSEEKNLIVDGFDCDLAKWVSRYEGKTSLQEGEVKQKLIHTFFQDSCLAALDFKSGEKRLEKFKELNNEFKELNNDMEVALWPVRNFDRNYEIELKRNGDDIEIHKVSRVWPHDKLLHKDDKHLKPGDGNVIRSVMFDTELGTEPVRLEKLD